MEKVVIGMATLYLADCREILPLLNDIDAVVADPAYGVGLGTRKNNNREKLSYTKFEDTPEYVKEVCVPVINTCQTIATRTVVTPGVKNMYLYQPPLHVGCFYYPAGVGCNSWGFSCWQPILYYGKDPYGGKGSRPDSFSSTEGSQKNGHPCPKPIGQMKWLVNRCSVEGETILDPFMGSGTTGVACVEMHRDFVGIEIEPEYFDIACKRIEKAQAQLKLFKPTLENGPDVAEQGELF